MTRLWTLLVALCAAGIVLASPFFLAFFRALHLPIPPAAALVLQALQIMVLCAVAAYGGVRFAARAGLDAPWLRAVAERRDRPPGFGGVAIESTAIGSVTAIAVTAVALMPRSPLTEMLLHPVGGFWARASGAFYGGIVEETLFRWGLLTAVAALLQRAGLLNAFWTANVLTALAFGALHLPANAARMQLTIPVVLQTLLGNGVAGVVFGWIFRRRGLEGAMVAHGALDVWLQAALPALLA